MSKELNKPEKILTNKILKDKFGNIFINKIIYNQKISKKDAEIKELKNSIGLLCNIKDKNIERLKEENELLRKRVDDVRSLTLLIHENIKISKDIYGEPYLHYYQAERIAEKLSIHIKGDVK